MAVQGKKLVEISKELIINKIGALSIYNYYIPGLKVGVPMKSPLRKEKNPSFVVKQSDNSYYHKDYGDSSLSGSAIVFVEQMFGLNFKQALEKIAGDFGLLEEGKEYKIVLKDPIPQQEKKKKIPDVIEVIPKPFGKEHLKYLSDFHISPNSLDIFPDVKVVAIKEYRLNRATMPLKRNEASFAYIMKEGIKIYKPFATKGEKWKNTIPNRIILGLRGLQPCETLIITKSVKEAAILHEHLKLPVVVVQSESASCFTEENVSRINSLAKNIYCSFDSDEPGKKANWDVTLTFGYKHVNVPDKYLQEGIKDWGDLIFKYGPEPIIQHFKEKQII